MTSLKRGVVARGVSPQKTIYLVREEGVGPVRGPIQRHFDLHSRPSDAQIVFRYQDTLKAAYRLYSEYDINLRRLSVPLERLPRLEALDEELFNMVATERAASLKSSACRAKQIARNNRCGAGTSPMGCARDTSTAWLSRMGS